MLSLVWKVGLSLIVTLAGFLVVLPIVNAREASVMAWSSPTTYPLNSVFMISGTDGWAVGYPGTIIHWNGTGWSNVTSPTRRGLYSVFMVGSNDGWAVGDVGTIIRWTGTAWVPEFPLFLTLPLLFITTVVASKFRRRRACLL